MKTKVRLTVVVEYEVDHDWYPGCETPEQVVEAERQNLEGDGDYLYTILGSHSVASETLELIA